MLFYITLYLRVAYSFCKWGPVDKTKLMETAIPGDKHANDIKTTCPTRKVKM